MNISIIDNTLQNYITKYIEQTFATHVSGNRYDKLYRELLIPIPITRQTDGQRWKKSHNEVSKIVEV